MSLRPDMLKWAPYIGMRTRASNLLLNTEHRKITQEDGKLEQDSRDITEERLLEMLHQSSLRDIRTFARQLGLNGTGSKLDIIMAIKKAVGIWTRRSSRKRLAIFGVVLVDGRLGRALMESCMLSSLSCDLKVLVITWICYCL